MLAAPFRKARATRTAPSQAHVTWAVDTHWSRVTFSAIHPLGAPVAGRIVKVEGEIAVDERDLAASRISVQAGLVCEGDGEAVGPILPTLGFTVRLIEPLDDERFRILGDLEVNGVTRPLELAMVEIGRGRDGDGSRRLRLAADGRINLAELPALDHALPLEWGDESGRAIQLHVELDVVGRPG